MRTTNKQFGLSAETIAKAKKYMIAEGYMDETTDIIDYTYCMVEGIPFMVKAKINQWATSYEQSQKTNC